MEKAQKVLSHNHKVLISHNTMIQLMKMTMMLMITPLQYCCVKITTNVEAQREVIVAIETKWRKICH